MKSAFRTCYQTTFQEGTRCVVNKRNSFSSGFQASSFLSVHKTALYVCGVWHALPALMTTSAILHALGLATLAFAQFPPTPEGVTTRKPKFHEGITISYKEPGICETTPGVRSYAGYVHLPPGAVNETHEAQDYPINTFFWFFESRKDPANAPLAIWLNGEPSITHPQPINGLLTTTNAGGPGGSSMAGALSENGPCFIGNDSNSTYLNPWAWNNEVNMLFLDQPNQVGYSYDVATNITMALLPEQFGSRIEPADFEEDVPEQNATFMVGTLSSQNASHTVNSTRHAAVALWHFAQTWFEEFPFYKPADEQISLFTESCECLRHS